MAYEVLMDYNVTNDKNAYAAFSIEQHNIEIEIIKSIVSNNCFINITIDSVKFVEGKSCTVGEPIINHSRNYIDSPLKGDFAFVYIDDTLINNSFDIQYLGDKLKLFYIGAD